MSATVFSDPRLFFDAVRPSLAAREIPNGMFLSRAKWIADADKSAFMIAWQSGQGVAIAALRIAPYPLLLAAAGSAPVERFADGVRDADAAIPAVFGEHEYATRFADRWAARAGHAWTIQHDLTFYTADRVRMPETPAHGRLRRATDADRPWLIDWYTAFADEVGLPPEERGRDQATLAVDASLRFGQQFVWEDDGPVVALSFAPTGLRGVRLRGVMTAPDRRGKGYGTSAVAALSRQLLAEGKWCGLFADRANPASNRLYQRLGYREACHYRSIRLA